MKKIYVCWYIEDEDKKKEFGVFIDYVDNISKMEAMNVAINNNIGGCISEGLGEHIISSYQAKKINNCIESNIAYSIQLSVNNRIRIKMY